MTAIQFSELLRDLDLKRTAALDEPRATTPEAMVADAIATIALAWGDVHAAAIDPPALTHVVCTRVRERIAGADRLTEHDLSALVETALIEAGAYDVAKALVLRRVLPPAGRETSIRLIRRTGEPAAWNPAKIEVAIRRAFLSLELDPAPAAPLARRVSERAHALGRADVAIEAVQDLVSEELVLAGHQAVAEAYIAYRAERALLRSRDDGDLRERIAFAAQGLDLALTPDELMRELLRSLGPGATSRDRARTIVLNAKALVERDAEYSRFAGRILLTWIYEETLDWDVVRDGPGGLRAAHERALRPALEHGVAIGRIDPTLLEYDLERLAAALDPAADLAFD